MSDLALLEAAREGLGFQLTGGQEQALDNVLRDLEGPAPMMCLLQVCCCLPCDPGTLPCSAGDTQLGFVWSALMKAVCA